MSSAKEPGRSHGRVPDDIATPKQANVESRVPPERQLAAWASAVEHLHALGLPAPVPEFAAAWLARQGIRADWTRAS